VRTKPCGSPVLIALVLAAGAACSVGDVNVQMAPGADAASAGGGGGGGGTGVGGAGGSIATPVVGCDEFTGGVTAVASLSIDAKAKAFVQAAADLQAVATSMSADVKTACANIATALGVTNTWASLSGNAAISNGQKTGACDQASAAMTAVLQANAGTSIVVTVSGGQCSVNADLQTSCESNCQAAVTCVEPSLDIRCDPGQLAGQCSGTCYASATCEGSATVAAVCQGTCSATCTGTCSGGCQGTITGGCTGTCEGKCDGVTTPAGGQANCAGTCEGTCSAPAATATCKGRCAASCTGTCSGNCKLDATANINCGANVNCKGGCSAAYTAPRCETELRPPACAGDANCQAGCSARAQLAAQCAPPTVDVLVIGSAPAILNLRVVLEANLPRLWLAAQTQGHLAANGAAKLAATGPAVVSSAASLGGKAVACVAVAASSTASASASVSVSVSASASVSGSAGAS
jgi:hypothetical protein